MAPLLIFPQRVLKKIGKLSPLGSKVLRLASYTCKNNFNMLQKNIQGRVPLLPVSVQAGFRSYYFDSLEEEVVYIPCPLQYQRANIAFSVVGRSMEPDFFEEDILFCLQLSRADWPYLPLRANDAYVLHYGDNFLALKYLKKNEALGCFQLLSANRKEFPPEYVRFEELRHIWKVIGKKTQSSYWQNNC